MDQQIKNQLNALQQLLELMASLRSDQGCDWDRQQTPESLRPYILEEAYELVDAINQDDETEICAELGDLLLQVVFLAQIYSERGRFSIQEVAEGIHAKLIRRHPHLFSDLSPSSPRANWEQIKAEERRQKGQSSDLRHRLPTYLPTLKLAHKVASEQNLEISPEYQCLDEDSLGQQLFQLIVAAQKQQIDADQALRKWLKNSLTNPATPNRKEDQKKDQLTFREKK